MVILEHVAGISRRWCAALGIALGALMLIGGCSREAPPLAAQKKLSASAPVSFGFAQSLHPEQIPTGTSSFDLTVQGALSRITLASDKDGGAPLALTLSAMPSGVRAAFPAGAAALKPGTAYELRAYFGDGTSRVLNFTTVTEQAAPLPLAVRAIRSNTPGTWADNLLEPKVLQVEPDAAFVIETTLKARPDAARITLSRADGTATAIHLDTAGEWLRVTPVEPLSRGQAYILRVRAGLEAESGGISPLQSEARVTVVVRRVGVLGAFEADLSGNGDPDRVVIFSHNRIGLITPNGANTARQDITLPYHANVKAAALEDFNRDGRVDIAVIGDASDGEGSILTWLENRSTGALPSFHAHTQRIAGLTRPTALVAVDLGRDGSMDLVAAFIAGKLAVLRRSSGAAASMVDGVSSPFTLEDIHDFSSMSGAILGIEPADLDRDGFPDFLISGADAGVAVFTSGVIGAFESALRLPFAGAELRFALEGNEGFVFARSSLDVRRIRASALRAAAGSKELAGESLFEGVSEGLTVLSGLLAADMNRNGMLDFLLVRRDGDDAVLRQWFRRRGEHPSDDGRVLSGVGGINGLAFAPLSGRVLVAAERGLYDIDLAGGSEAPLSFDSDTVFGQPKVVAAIPPMRQYVLGDFNGDGLLDVAGLLDEAGRRVLRVWLNRVNVGEGLTPTALLDASAFDRLLVIDSNRDGLADLILLSEQLERGGRLYRSRGDGGFAEGDDGYLMTSPDDARGIPALADFNGDGYDDLFWATPTGAVSFGSATRFHKEMRLPALADSTSPGAFFTITGETQAWRFSKGRSDVVAVGEVNGYARLAIYRNRLSYGATYLDFEGIVLPGEFDEIGDIGFGMLARGVPGIVAAVRFGSAWGLYFWLDPLSPAAQPMRLLPDRDFFASRPTNLQVIDIDHDGDADIAFTAASEQGARKLLLVNNGAAQFSESGISAETLAKALAVIGGELIGARFVDLNGDGRPDLLAQTPGGKVYHAPSR